MQCPLFLLSSFHTRDLLRSHQVGPMRPWMWMRVAAVMLLADALGATGLTCEPWCLERVGKEHDKVNVLETCSGPTMGSCGGCPMCSSPPPAPPPGPSLCESWCENLYDPCEIYYQPQCGACAVCVADPSQHPPSTPLPPSPSPSPAPCSPPSPPSPSPPPPWPSSPVWAALSLIEAPPLQASSKPAQPILPLPTAPTVGGGSLRTLIRSVGVVLVLIGAGSWLLLIRMLKAMGREQMAREQTFLDVLLLGFARVNEARGLGQISKNLRYQSQISISDSSLR